MRWVLTLIIINAFDLGLGIGVQQSLVKKEPETNDRLQTILIDNAEAENDVHRRSVTEGFGQIKKHPALNVFKEKTVLSC